MAWYNNWFAEKSNPAQELIYFKEGSVVNTDSSITYTQAFEKLETVNRGVNMLVSACSSLDYDIKDKKIDGVVAGIKAKQLVNLLNYRPNPFQSAMELRVNMFTDFVLEGNIFLYYDGTFLYHLPAAEVEIHPDPKSYISHYTYRATTKLSVNEVIHIKDLSSTSIYRGSSRLASADRNIKILYQMQDFQKQFFENGAVAGIVLTTPNTLGEAAKERTINRWTTRYSPKNGARRPMILDSGLKPDSISSSSFQEMDFDVSIKTHDTKIMKAIGVPPLLLDGGNNANISPNLRLFYLETVMPIIDRYVSAMERFTGYDIAAITSNVSALQPEIKEIAAYYSTLVNGGIVKPNEARLELRLPLDTDPESNKLRVPANIAGSAANPSLGGAPKKPAEPDKSI